SAVAKCEASTCSPDSPSAEVKITITYQIVAIMTEITTSLPTCRAGTLASSADCGITSKPTNKNGTAIITAKKPLTPEVNSGSRLRASPPVNAPVRSMRPTTSRNKTTNVCTMPAIFVPLMLIHVRTTAVTTPINAQVRLISKPATVHSGMWLILGQMYSIVFGTATASNAMIVTYP